jgi:hypothetical protein
MKTYGEVEVQLHPPAALNPGKTAPAPTVEDAESAPEPVWRYGEEKSFLPLPGTEPQFLSRPTLALIATDPYKRIFFFQFPTSRSQCPLE